MKKQLVIVGTTILLLVVVLSGCEELKELEEEIEGEQEEEPSNMVESSNSDFVQITDYEMKISSTNGHMYVYGTAKNTADSMLTVSIIGKFFDENHTYLGDDFRYGGSKNSKYKIPAGYSWDFILCFMGEYEDKAQSVEFEIL